MTTATPVARIFATTVEVDGVHHPRCVRARGLDRCQGVALVEGGECQWHPRERAF